MKRKHNTTRKEKGITLIALVVTIIAIIILAVISLSSLMGENGLITNSRFASFSTEVKELEERAKLKLIMGEEEYSGSINELLDEENPYNTKLIIQDNELKYLSSGITTEEEGWLIKLGIGKADDYFKVEFDSAGGTEIESQSIRSGKLAEKPNNPIKAGHEFIGWYYLKESGTESNPTYEEKEFDFNSIIAKDYSLYAKYEGETIMVKASSQYLWSCKSEITEILFTGDSSDIPTNVKESWNVSTNSSNPGEIKAYLEDTTNRLVIHSDKTIYANPNMNDFFRYFSNVSSITFKNFNTSKVKLLRSTFLGCSKIENLDLKAFDTSKVTNMYNIFYGCSSLTSIDLSSFNTSRVTTMYGMFKNCTVLRTLDITNFETPNVKSLRTMFDGCNDLESIDLSSFDTSKVTDVYKMFNVCKNIKVIDISNFDTSKVTYMAAMFYNCPKLTTIYASDKFSTESIDGDSGYIFRYNNSLVGGNGTRFSSSHTDKEYARLDKGSEEPGYFTLKQ